MNVTKRHYVVAWGEGGGTAAAAEQQRNPSLIVSVPGIVQELPGEVSRLVGIRPFGILMVAE